MAKIMIVDGPRKGEAFELSGELTVGRTPENPISLDSKKVSREHARFITTAQGTLVRDLGSSNGTYVNGKRIKEQKLKDGDRVRIGEYTFQLGGRPTSASAPAGKQRRGARRVAEPSSSASVAAPSELAGKTAGLFFRQAWSTQVALLLGGLFLAAVISSVPLLLQVKNDFRDFAREQGIVAARTLALQNSELMRRGEALVLDTTTIQQSPGVKEAILLDANLEALAPAAVRGVEFRGDIFKRAKATTAVATELKPGGLVHIAVPVQVWDPDKASFEFVGIAFVEFSPAALVESRTRTAYMRTLVGLLLVLAGCAGAFVLFNRMTHYPLTRVIDDTELLLRGDLAVVSPSGISWRGLDALVSSINRLAARGGRMQTPDAALDPTGQKARLALPQASSGAPPPLLALVAAVQDAALVIDDGSRVLCVNGAAARLFGASKAECAGRHLLDVVKDQAWVGALLDVVSQAGEADGGDHAQATIDAAGAQWNLYAEAGRNGAEVAATAIVIRASTAGSDG